MHARIYVENYSREEGNELTLPRNYYGPHFTANASAVSAIMTSRRRALYSNGNCCRDKH